MTAKAEVKGLHAKLAEVMAEAERIPKNGKAPAAMGGYPFVQVGDAADYIRKALGGRGVSMLPSAVEIVGVREGVTKNGAPITTAELLVTWTLTDAETDQSAVIQSYGVGADGGDKYSGKAMTNAMKYALLAGFLLSTGEDVEQHDTERGEAETVGGERLEHLGALGKAGTIRVGSASQYKAEWRQTPDGMAIGVRLETNQDPIPQVLITGAIGQAVHMATEGNPQQLIGTKVKVRGQLYFVKPAPPRQGYYRLVIGERDEDFIETAEWRVPAEPPSVPPAPLETGPGDAPTEAPSLPAFDLAEVDAMVDAAEAVQR